MYMYIYIYIYIYIYVYRWNLVSHTSYGEAWRDIVVQGLIVFGGSDL